MYRKIGSRVYEVGNTEYRVELMNDGSWDAYFLHGWGYRLWQSPKHRTRESARMAITAELRRLAKEIKQAVTK